MLYCAIIIFRRPDRYASLAACALSLTLSHGRGNSVAVVFAVTRFLPLRILVGVCFYRQSYRFSNLAPSCGGGLGRGRQTAGLLYCAFHYHFQTA
ncbi:hypothetical protein LVJ83_03900 [Uruburuella testudinis]|uniref:Secreted protein n=1 Tax=Uruburuella testudinis TaxID=1282863 RepID=A0ABY4DUT9_9NEIS|nr:hypothetical protein [Uruburuella testudinis]UOO82613.1 hypothetical protein LVJ83_03900 [Uruburuella testudinis]